MDCLREISVIDNRVPRQAVDDHLAILDGLAAEDGDTAAAAMSRHIVSIGGL
jgi:DNA-binding GntR family transcriptional regulator